MGRRAYHLAMIDQLGQQWGWQLVSDNPMSAGWNAMTMEMTMMMAYHAMMMWLIAHNDQIELRREEEIGGVKTVAFQHRYAEYE